MSSRQQPSQVNVFPDSLSSLRKAGQSLQKLTGNLSFCNHSLELYTNEIPRLNLALKSSQFFELVSASEIRTAQYQLTSELEPQIKELVKLTETNLVKLQKREQMLRTNILKRKNLSTTDRNEDDEIEDEDEEGKSSTISNENIEEQEKTLEDLRTRKNLLLKEIERLDCGLKKKRTIFKSLQKASS